MPRGKKQQAPAEIPVDSSWRMVDSGENDSFDTSVVHDFSPEDMLLPTQMSQLSSDSQGLSIGSQDSYTHGGGRPEEDLLIKRMSFAPSIASTRQASTSSADRTTVPEFRMPQIDVPTSPGRRGGRSTRSAKAAAGSAQVRQRRRYDHDSFDQDEFEPRPRYYGRTSSGRAYEADGQSEYRPATMSERFASSVPEFFFNIGAWFISVMGMTLQMAKLPIAIILLVYLLIGAGMTTKNVIFGNLSALPICHLPLVSFPFCDYTKDGSKNGTGGIDFDLNKLMSAQDDFEKVLEASAEGVSLPMEMKRSEATVRDLRTMVKYSDLAARDELVLELDGYVDTVRIISTDLQTFNTHVGSAVDSVISINRWTSRYIDSIAAYEESRDNTISRWGDWLFSPFQPAQFDESFLVDKYIEHTAMVSDKIAALIMEAQAALRLLTQAENHLQLINEHVVRNGNAVREKKTEIFWTLWTLVGANTRRLHNLSSQLTLLNRVEVQRTEAVAQLMGLIHDLGDIQTKLGDLRERVAAPELLADDPHGASIPLSVHIETINAGVERLEGARKRIRAEENERLERALAKAREEDRLIEG